MVERPAEFTVPELINLLPSYTIPVTLVCAGEHACSPDVRVRVKIP